MTFRSLFILLFCVTGFTAFSQCIEKQQIGFSGSWYSNDFMHLCPTYTFTFNGDTSKNWGVYFGRSHIDISQAPVKIFALKNSIDKKIKSFAGDSFYSKVQFSFVEIVYPNKLKALKDSGFTEGTLKYCKVKYFFYYQFNPDTNTIFHFGIAVDKYGKIISKFDFPSKENYKSFDTSFSYCKIIAKAREIQKNIDPIREVTLEYNEKMKRFCWSISQDIIKLTYRVGYYNHVYIDASDLSKATTSKVDVTIIY